MEKIKNSFNEKAKTLKERVEKDRIENGKKDNLECRTINEKLCPFMSNAHYQVACTPQCKFYRADKKGFECPISELASISWNLSRKNKR